MTRAALITGASSRIGRATAVRLASEGWHVLAHGRREDGLRETLEQVDKAGGSGELFTAEMGDMAAVGALADRAASRESLDAMIHCAANRR